MEIIVLVKIYVTAITIITFAPMGLVVVKGTVLNSLPKCYPILEVDQITYITYNINFKERNFDE
mgnify:CR=1 FL=1